MTISQHKTDVLAGHPTIRTASAHKSALASQSIRGPPLLGVPLDIAFEVAATFDGNYPRINHAQIFSLVWPIDLLQLARTSKALRAHLMSRSSAPIWTACRQQVEGLPPCPKHLSDPQYFDLAFDHHCQVSGTIWLIVWSVLLMLL